MTREAVRPIVLVVDDNDEVRETLLRMFKRSDWEGHGAQNGRDALEIVRKVNVQVMLVDLKMPGMGGLELLRTARTLVSELEVVVVTGYGTIEKAVEAMKEVYKKGLR